MTQARPVQPPAFEPPPGWFRDLKVGHDPKDPPEATLVLAAAAAANGLRCDGRPMDGAEFAAPPSFKAIARQLLQPISAVRRGFHHLQARGAAYLQGGVCVRPEALAERWAPYRQRLRISTEARRLRMRPKALLLTALVEGQVYQRGQLRLGIPFLRERTGFPRRSLERALATARKAGAIHTWVSPGDWQLFLALGPSRNGARRGSQSGARREAEGGEWRHNAADDPTHDHETAHPPITNRRSHDHETAEGRSRSGARTPDTSGVPDSPPDAPASPAGESRAAPATADAEADKRQPQPGGAEGVKAIIDSWVKNLATTWCLSNQSPDHVSKVASLIDSISPRPPVIHDLRAFFRERLDLAHAVIRWCPSAERLGRWLLRASRWFGVNNLGAYLRRASEKGDPGTFLESHTKNVLGRGAEDYRDFSTETERKLEGPASSDIKQMTAGLAEVLSEHDEIERARLREELRKYLGQKRPVAARAVLLKLVGHDRSDHAVAAAIGDACTLDQAKELLAA